MELPPADHANICKLRMRVCFVFVRVCDLVCVCVYACALIMIRVICMFLVAQNRFLVKFLVALRGQETTAFGESPILLSLAKPPPLARSRAAG